MTATEFIASGAARLAAEWSGHGAPVVLLHAAVADRRMWRLQLTALAPHYQAIAYDRRGFGETGAADEPYSQQGDLMAVLDRLVPSGKRVVLVGCSQGGSIAIDAALASPDRIAGLVLVSPSVGGAPVPRATARVQHLLDAIDAAGQAGDLVAVNQLKAKLFLDGALAPEGRVQGAARQLFLEMNGLALKAQGTGRAIAAPPAWDRLAEIRVPVRVLCGDLDIPHIQERCQTLVTRVPDGRCEPLAGTAHLPSLDQPRQVSERLLALLAEIVPAALAPI